MHTGPVPGARLTQDDRRRIAAWLTEGLGYAEIARRLDRPTSTISREVARNGVPGDYRPDHAQQAAAQRVHRRTPRPPQPPDVGNHFVEQFASLLTETGFPKMTARVFVCLLTSDSGSVTAADLVRRLRVSPASVSKSIGYLERMDLIARRPDPGGRRERYTIVDDVWRRAWRTDTDAHTKVSEAARRGAELFGADTPAGHRLAEMSRFFTWLSGQMNDSNLAEHDALTVLAALAYAARPLAVADLAAALDWPGNRVTEALAAIEARPILADPLALTSPAPGTYAVTTRPDRLSPAQREALRQPAGGRLVG
jgi:DNA-binding MarR family transcriptional regulator